MEKNTKEFITGIIWMIIGLGVGVVVTFAIIVIVMSLWHLGGFYLMAGGIFTFAIIVMHLILRQLKCCNTGFIWMIIGLGAVVALTFAIRVITVSLHRVGGVYLMAGGMVTFAIIAMHLILRQLKCFNNKEKMSVKKKGFIYGFVLWMMIVFIFYVGVYPWQTWLPGYGEENIVVTGFSKLRPIAPSIMYTGATGDFTVSFTNPHVGTRIELINASVTDKFHPFDTSWTVPTINGMKPDIHPQAVKAGGTFKLDSIESNKLRTAGEPFDLEITITYTSVMGGIKTSHMGTGRISGPVE